MEVICGNVDQFPQECTVIASTTINWGADACHTCIVYGEVYPYTDPVTTKVYLAHMCRKGDISENHLFLYHGWFDECGYIQ